MLQLFKITLAATLLLVACPATGDENGKELPLAAAVKEFNQRALKDETGRDQLPLTEDEVVAAIRGWIRERTPATDQVYQTYQTIADTRLLPAGATLSSTTQWGAFNNYQFEVWWIDLNIMVADKVGYTFRIRDQKLRCWPSGEAPPKRARPAKADQPSSKISPEDIEKLLVEFRKVYHLAPGQVIKRIKAPYPAGRMYDLDQRMPEFHVLTGTIYSEANLSCLIYRERNGKHEERWPFFAYSNDGAAKGYEAGSLLAVIGNVEYGDIQDPKHLLLDQPVFGDFVMNADAPPDKVLAAFGEILKNECGLPVKLELREDENRIVVVRGRFKPPFVPKLDTPIELYAATLQPGKGERDQGTFDEFLKDVGMFIEPNYRVVNAIEDARQDKLSWHRNIRLRFDDKTLQEDRDARQVLDHLEEQTGLKFTIETRKFRKVSVMRSE